MPTKRPAYNYSAALRKNQSLRSCRAVKNTHAHDCKSLYVFPTGPDPSWGLTHSLVGLWRQVEPAGM